jgi:hypothetical protein
VAPSANAQALSRQENILRRSNFSEVFFSALSMTPDEDLTLEIIRLAIGKGMRRRGAMPTPGVLAEFYFFVTNEHLLADSGITESAAGIFLTISK